MRSFVSWQDECYNKMYKSTEKNPNKWPFSLGLLCFCAKGLGEGYPNNGKVAKNLYLCPARFSGRMLGW